PRGAGPPTARHEHAEPRDRGGLGAFDARLAVHALRYRADRRLGDRGDGRVSLAALVADDLLAALAEEERATRRSAGDLALEGAERVVLRRPSDVTLDRDDPLRPPAKRREPLGELPGARAQERAHAVVVAIDRAERDGHDRVEQLVQPAVHLLVRRRARREP